MRIQHNIMAMNAYRNLGMNNRALSGNLEKLSSGYRINRAGDDAAGLAISEKMRAQITGLDAAQKNVADGISLVKTAEGAMQEIQDMMNRMEYLATQSANGTYDNDVDRANLQKEVEALKSEINRIADSSNFNGTKLLDGSLGADALKVNATIGVEGTEKQDLKIDEGNFAASDIAKANPKQTFTAVQAAAGHAMVEVSFADEEGVSYSFTLISNKDNSATDADTAITDEESLIVGALKGTDAEFNVSTADGTDGGGEAFAKFKELFTVAGNSDGTFTVTANKVDSTAKVTSMGYGSTTDLTNANLSAATTKAMAFTSEEGHEAFKIYTATATGTDGAEHKFTVGEKEYVVKESGTATTATAIAKDLIKQLQADGYDVSLVDTNGKASSSGASIKFNEPAQENQKGVQIVNTADDKFTVEATAGVKGATKITMGTPAEQKSEATFTVNYVNGDNESVTKTFTYNTGTTAATSATNLLTAMQADEDFAAVFDVAAGGGAGEITLTNKGTGSAYGVVNISTTDAGGATQQVTTKGTDSGKTLKLENSTSAPLKAGDQITIDGKVYQFVDDLSAVVDEGVTKVELGAAGTSMENLVAALEKNGVKAEYDSANNAVIFADNVVTVEGGNGKGGLTLQIGDTADSFNQMTVSVNDMHVKALGIGDLDISTQAGAQAAVDVIKDAINKVSSTRGDLGAIQNRLEHTSNNLAVMEENITDAESSIRDTDIADEMMAYTKNNILIQSAQAMLAQANQVPQGVLQLMQ